MRKLTVRVNGIDLYLRAGGNANAPLIRFLHGFPESSGAWEEVNATAIAAPRRVARLVVLNGVHPGPFSARAAGG